MGDIALANDASDQRITSAVHRHFNNMLELLPSGTDRVGIIEGFTNEEKWVTALLSTEGEARMDNDALKPRLKAEVSMEGYHFLSW